MRKGLIFATIALLMTNGISSSASPYCGRSCTPCVSRPISYQPGRYCEWAIVRTAPISIPQIAASPSLAGRSTPLMLSRLQPIDLPKSVAAPEWGRLSGKEVTWLARLDSDQPVDPTAMRIRFISDDIIIDGYFTDFEHLKFAKTLRPGSIVVLRGTINMPYAKAAIRLDASRIMSVQRW